MYVGDFEVRVYVAEALSKEGCQTCRRAFGGEDALWKRVIDNPFDRCPTSVKRVGDIGRDREAVALEVVMTAVDVRMAPTAAHYHLFFMQIGESDTWLDVIPICVGRYPINTIYVGEVETSLQLRQERKLCMVNHTISRVDDTRIEAAIESIIPLVRRLVDVPAYAEVERQRAAHLPIVLEPGRIVFSEGGREDPVFHVAIYVA